VAVILIDGCRKRGDIVDNRYMMQLLNTQKNQMVTELMKSNELLARFGLQLTQNQLETIIEKRYEALKDNGRIELLSNGIVDKLIYAFCDSPYISQDNFEEILIGLQDSFYYFKNDSVDNLTDDELIQIMKEHFDGDCEGSLEYLNGTVLEALCRNIREDSNE